MNPSAPSMPSPPSSASRRAVLVCSAFLLIRADARATTPAINTLKSSRLGGRGQTAIHGYDTVAYFTLGKAVDGDDSFTTDWKGALWRFSSQAHLDLFKRQPERYAPQYGGYCAFGVAQGYLVKVDPQQFAVREGKLYLNFDAQVQRKWLADQASFIAKADVRFPELLKK